MADYNPLSYVRKYVTDPLGITNPPPPDLSKGPDAQALRDFASQIKGDYTNFSPGVSRFERDQHAAMALLNSAARGNAPSAAEALQRKGLDEAIASQLGMAGTLQGVNPGAAMRAGLFGASNMEAKTAADTAALRAQEIASAQQRLIDAASAFRGQDIQNLDVNNRMKLGLGNLAETSLLAPYNAAIANQQLQLQNQAANQAGIGTLATAGARYAGTR